MPQAELLKLLDAIPKTSNAESVIGVGLDSCVLKTRIPDVFLVQTTDFFYPLVCDIKAQGRIAAANVLSDLYAMGVTHCDNVLMLLAISLDMKAEERRIATALLIEGFTDACREAGTSVNGGQTVFGPWAIIGGVATSVCQKGDFIIPNAAEDGDVLVLTKPLGTQPAVNAFQWLDTDGFERISDVITPEETVRAYRMAMHSMARLNLNGARLMSKYGAKGATDVTGFGLIGHAGNLAAFQTNKVDFVIDVLPIIPKMVAVNSKFNFRLLEGFSAETSGGLFVVLPREASAAFCRELEALDGVPAWVVGRVVPGTGQALIASDVKILDASTPEL